MKNKVIGALMLCGACGAVYGTAYGAVYLTSYYGTLLTMKIISKYFL